MKKSDRCLKYPGKITIRDAEAAAISYPDLPTLYSKFLGNPKVLTIFVYQCSSYKGLEQILSVTFPELELQ